MTDPSIEAEIQAQQRAAFDSAMAEARESAPEPEPEPEVEPEVEPENTPEATEPPAETETETEVVEDGPTSWSADALKARRNLELKGIFDETEIEAMGPERAMSKWAAIESDAKLAKELQQERAELRRELDALKAAKGPEPELSAAPAGSMDLSEAVQNFREEFGDDAGGLVEQLVSTIKGLEARVVESEQGLSSVANERRAQAMEVLTGAQTRLAQEIPALADPDTFDSVLGQMNTIANLPKYASLSREAKAEAVMRDSADLLGLVTAAEAPRPAPRQGRKQPVTASQNTKSQVPKPVDADRKVFNEVWARHRK